MQKHVSYPIFVQNFHDKKLKKFNGSFFVFKATLTLTNGGLDSTDGDAASQESFDLQASLKKKKKFTGELPQLVEPSSRTQSALPCSV